jgi:flavin reductase (DIM6/NTAB) family NADH-FMN oxidoreductase RutF
MSDDSRADPTAHFEEVSEHDSKSIFKPNVANLVVSNSDREGPNVMTASWWMLGGYAPFRYVLAVGEHEYTHEIIEANPEFVLAAPSTDMTEAFSLCGNVSGREVDKIEHLGLETIPGESVDVPLLANAVGNVECSVMESFSFEGITYYIAGVEQAYVKKGMLNGRILSADAKPLAFMGSDWENEDDEHKHRYYVDFEDEDVKGFPDGAVLDGLPDDAGE